MVYESADVLLDKFQVAFCYNEGLGVEKKKLGMRNDREARMQN
ncbi:135_t:CDS:2 [Dentiscutata erythropus]|uniref:135_t:CDS:1 n=1 Tax=Dentiscutata erythropus TaxID=1348616 RepID=A0A9N9NMP0_9GLOM|nr:135_t:CDS:2 [Dentiscutata erythropus]